jgi:hypothetical protein
MTISDDPPIVHEVPEITSEVYKDAGDEALDTNQVIVVYETPETQSTPED